MTSPLRIGLVVNPYAGIGGPVGLKGSDGVYEQAQRLGGISRVAERVGQAIEQIDHSHIHWVTVTGAMGEDILKQHAVPFEVLNLDIPAQTTAEDTRRATQYLCEAGIDLLLFAGGDGTARDVADGFNRVPAVLGIPAGVKMHSGVFATTPSAAAMLVNKLASGDVLTVMSAEVRDIDEASFREGSVHTKFYGELPVPADVQYVQATKIGGKEVEELVVQEIAADFIEGQQPDVMYIMGSGSTVSGILDAMSLPSTLLGIDVLRNGQIEKLDATERDLLALLESGHKARIIVTAIGGQGHIFGRGNQQISASVIRKVGIENIDVVATRTKLNGLEGKSLVVDTGDPALDQLLAGVRSIVTGYEDRVLYRIG